MNLISFERKDCRENREVEIRLVQTFGKYDCFPNCVFRQGVYVQGLLFMLTSENRFISIYKEGYLRIYVGY